MTAQANVPCRPFLDVTGAKTTIDLGALKDSLSDAVRDAERLGLPEVKEHIETALAHVAKRVEDEGGA